MKPICFIQGEFIPVSEARIAPDDLGVLRGYAVYEGITVVRGVPFHFHEHFTRLTASAAAVGLVVPISEEDAYNATCTLVEKNAYDTERVSIRVMVTGGTADHGIIYHPENSIFYLLAEPAAPHDPTLYENGGSLMTHEFQRFLPKCKTTDYIVAVQLQHTRLAKGAAEILYTNNSTVTECATSNIFMIKNGVLITPKDNILEGITRKVTLELARANNYTVEERTVSVDELMAADEVFITSSFRDILPIVKINDATIGDGKVGSVTKALTTLFANNLNETH